MFFTLAVCLICTQFCSVYSLTIKAEEQSGKATEMDSSLQLFSQSAVLLDGESGRVLYGKDEMKERPMASTTKIMTCILALELGNSNDIVTVSQKAASQPEVHLGMKNGDSFYLNDLLFSLMLESHNDSAWAVAEHIGDGSVEKFTGLMNKKAEEIGCDNTHFVTPNGLDGEDEGGIHRTTAEDLAKIMRYCIMVSPKKKEFLSITQTRSKEITDTSGKKKVICRNHNAFLDMMDGALTGKTGFTADAGYCYVGAVRKEEKTLIVALLACGWPNNKGYKWKDMKTLIQYGLNNYTYRYFWQEAEENETIRLLQAGKQKTVSEAAAKKENLYHDGVTKIFLDITSEQKEKRILMRPDEKISLQIHEKEKMHAPVKRGDKAGNVEIYLGDQKLDEQGIYVGEAVPRKTFRWVYQNIWKEFLYGSKE